MTHDTPDFGLLARGMRRMAERVERERSAPRRIVERCGVGDVWAVHLNPPSVEHTDKEPSEDAKT